MFIMEIPNKGYISSVYIDAFDKDIEFTEDVRFAMECDLKFILYLCMILDIPLRDVYLIRSEFAYE